MSINAKTIGNISLQMKKSLCLEIATISSQLSGKDETVNVTMCNNRIVFHNYIIRELKKRTSLKQTRFFVSSLPAILFMPYPPPEICIDLEDLAKRSDSEKRLALAHEIAHYVLKEYPPHGGSEFMSNLNRIYSLTKDEGISREYLSILLNLIGDTKAYKLMFRSDISYRQLSLEALLEEKKRLNIRALRESIDSEDLTFPCLVLHTARSLGKVSVILALQEFDRKLADEYENRWFEVINEVMANVPLVSLAIRRLIKRYSEFRFDLDSVVDGFIRITTECFQGF
ncbi:MAG: hypothetical protein ABSD73_09470 [Candidatus Bathyarchaeia archaeon]